MHIYIYIYILYVYIYYIYPNPNPLITDFFAQCGIKLISHGLDGNKWPFKEIDEIDIKKVLNDVLNPLNRPLLIHCNKGKHRTGSVVGCLRKIRGWALSSIVSEYMLFAAPKTRLEDQRYIEDFDVAEFEEEYSSTNYRN
jgi:tyrosine-protein phosphatase SIW14